MSYELFNQQYLVKITVCYIKMCYLYHTWKDRFTLLFEYIEPLLNLHTINISDSFKAMQRCKGTGTQQGIKFLSGIISYIEKKIMIDE